MRRKFTAAVGLSLSLATAMSLSSCVMLHPGVSAGQANTDRLAAHTQIVGLPADIQDRGVLVIGSQLSSPPLIFQTEGAKSVEGINKDIADEIGNRLKVRVEWIQFPFAGLIPAVQSGKVDAAMDVIGDTEQRRAAVDFADYMNQGTSPLVRRGNPDKVHSVDDLCGLPVAVIRGAVQLELAEETSKKCIDTGKQPVQINQYGNPGDARLAVQAGRDTAFLGNTPVMRYISEQEATKATFEMGGEATYQLQPIGIITAKSKTSVHDSIQSAVDLMQADGSLAKVLAKWHAEDLALKSPAKEGK